MYREKYQYTQLPGFPTPSWYQLYTTPFKTGMTPLVSIQTTDVFYGLYRYRDQPQPFEKHKHSQKFQRLLAMA